MTTERKHRCGGTLQSRPIQVQDERGGMLMVYRVQGLVCEACQEEMIDRDTLLTLEKSQTPTVVWDVSVTSQLSQPVFYEQTASTTLALAA